MVVEPADAVDLAGDHVLGRVAAGRLVDQLDVHAGLVVVAQLLREHVGQVDLLRQPADHDRDLTARRPRWIRRRLRPWVAPPLDALLAQPAGPAPP